MTRFKVADETAAIFIHIYGETGEFLRPGDICYI